MCWQVVSLGNVLSQRKEFRTIDEDKIYARCRVQTRARGITLRDHVLGSYIKTKRQQICRSGEFLVAEIDAKVGGFGIVPQELDGAIVSSHYFLFEIDQCRLRTEFLNWVCRTAKFREQVNARGTTNYSAIRPTQLLDYKIPLPPLAEQARLASILDRINMATVAALQLSDEIDQHLIDLVQSLHFHSSDANEGKLGDFLELSEDRVPVESGKEYRQIGLRSYCKGLFFKPSLFGDDTKYSYFNRLSRGLLVVSQPKGWEGAISVCEKDHEDWYVSPEYRTFRCREDVLDEQYLSAFLPTRWFQLQLSKLTRGQGARRQRLRPEMLLDMRIRMPSIAQQRMVLSILRKLRRIQGMRRTSGDCMRVFRRASVDTAFHW